MDKALLFKPNLPQGEVEIEGRGTIRVRGMTREELHTTKNKDTGAGERVVLAACLVDPVLTVDEVLLWQQASPAGELNGVIAKIMELSKLGDGDDKSDLPGVSG